MLDPNTFLRDTRPIRAPLDRSNDWVVAVAGRLGRSRAHAWRTLSVTLPALRDQLPSDVAAALSASLPTMARSLFWAGWRPDRLPSGGKAFFEAVTIGLQFPSLKPKDAARAVFDELVQRMPGAEMERVRDSLPRAVRRLWRVHAAHGTA